MLLRRLTDFILQGRVQAMALVFVLAFVPVVGSISIVIAALVTLRKGVFEGALVTLAATVPYLLGYLSYPAPDRTTMTLVIVSVMIVSNMLTWLFAVMLRRCENWSWVIEAATLLGLVMVVVIHMVHPDIQGWWQVQLTDYFTKNVAVTAGQLVEGATVAQQNEQAAELISRAKEYATGFIAVSVLFNALLQLVLARWWQAIIFNPGGLRSELRQIRLDYFAAAVFVVMAVLAFLGNALVLDSVPVLYAAFCAAGLSLAHGLCSLTRFGWLILLLIYVGSVLLFPLSAMIIAIIALIDTVFDFRKRLRKSAS